MALTVVDKPATVFVEPALTVLLAVVLPEVKKKWSFRKRAAPPKNPFLMPFLGRGPESTFNDEFQ